MRWGVHGDDFVGSGPRALLEAFFNALSKTFIVKLRGILGPRKTDLKRMILLERAVEWCDGSGGSSDYLTWQGDTRHIPLLAETLGLKMDSKG